MFFNKVIHKKSEIVNKVFSYSHSTLFTSFLWSVTETGIYIMVNEREIPDNFLRSFENFRNDVVGKQKSLQLSIIISVRLGK